MNQITGIIITDHYDNLTYETIRSLLKICDQINIVESKNFYGEYKLAENIRIKRFKQTKILNHSELRNIGLENSHTKWVFILDSDEILSINLIKAIPHLIQDENLEGVWFSRRNYISSKKYLKFGLFYPDYQLRLIKANKEYSFKGAIHPQILIQENRTKYVKLDILHFARHPKYSRFSDFANFKTYIDIETKELMKVDMNPFIMIATGIWKTISIFLSGFFRGKGFLDGWDGFRAHIIFATYIGYEYVLAGIGKIKTQK